MAETMKVGKCMACGKEVYFGNKSRRFIGHKPDCKNTRTEKLSK